MVLTCICFVELPGIDPATKNNLTCGNAGFGCAKRRQKT